MPRSVWHAYAVSEDKNQRNDIIIDMFIIWGIEDIVCSDIDGHLFHIGRFQAWAIRNPSSGQNKLSFSTKNSSVDNSRYP